MPQAVGHLHCLWWWGLDNTPDGVLDDLAAQDIADAAGWEGDADHFLAAMISARFVDQRDGHYELHDWWEFAGKLIERRKHDAARKRAARRAEADPGDIQAQEEPEEPDIQIASAGRPPDVFRTQPNSTVPNHTEQNSGGGGHLPTARPREEPAPVDEEAAAAYEVVSDVLGVSDAAETVSLVAEAIRQYPEIPHVLEARNCAAYYQHWSRRTPAERGRLYAKWLQKAEQFAKEDAAAYAKGRASPTDTAAASEIPWFTGEPEPGFRYLEELHAERVKQSDERFARNN